MKQKSGLKLYSKGIESITMARQLFSTYTSLLILNFFHETHKGKARLSNDDNRKALVRYSIFAWISPAVIVITSVTLDKTNTVSIGYGELNIN